MIKDELIPQFYAVDRYVLYHGWQTAPFAFTDMEQAQEYISRYCPGNKTRIISYVRSPVDDRYEEW